MVFKEVLVSNARHYFSRKEGHGFTTEEDITLSRQGRTGRGVRMDSAFGIRCYVVVVDLAEAVLVVVPNARVLQSMRNPGAMICFCGFDDICRIK